jgi:hypothetical protein
MYRQSISNTLVCVSVSVLLLTNACQSDPELGPSESTGQALTAASTSAAENRQNPDVDSSDKVDLKHAHRMAALAAPDKQRVAQNGHLIRYQSPLETGRTNATKEKAGKSFTPPPPPPVVAPVSGAEHRRRVNQYLAQWDQQKSSLSSRTEAEQEAARAQLKHRVLGGQP